MEFPDYVVITALLGPNGSEGSRQAQTPIARAHVETLCCQHHTLLPAPHFVASINRVLPSREHSS
jgi:hypothetical protein